MESAPPRAKPTSRIAKCAVSIQNDAIHTVVAAVQQIRILCTQLVGPHVRQDSNAASTMLPRRGHFFAAESAKKRRTFIVESCIFLAEKFLRCTRKPIA